MNKENKMGVMPINRLLLSMSLPMMISMLVQALYNIIDSIFVAQINEQALTAVSLAFPIQNLMIAVASGTSVGVNAMLSKALGEKKFDRANLAAKNGLFLSAVSCVVFVILGLFFSRIFFASQTDDADIVEYGFNYLSVITVFSAGLFGEMMLERLLQSTGRSFYSMITQSVGAVVNIVLDPIMIFSLNLGVRGAAIATCIGQFSACILALILNIKKNSDLNLNLKGFRPSGSIIKHIYSVGLPSILMMSISSVMTYGMNKILIGFTSTAAAIFGVYYKLQSFVFMPVFGFNNGMVPIIAYNFGARKSKRIVSTIKLSYLYATAIMIVGMIIFQTIPSVLLGLFNSSDEMLRLGIPALRIISIHFVLAGVGIISGSIFQALGHGMKSLIVSVARQLVVLLPSAYLLSLSGNLYNVWFAFPIAELVSFTICIIFIRQIFTKVIRPLDN